ncbi:MAG: hypothetical protein J4472_03595, partial [DPANN group archaeon]|nr:hypothetical protein [DPANN group archaeon]
MQLSSRELKFLTIMNETRLSDGKIHGQYSKEVAKQFQFEDAELNSAVKKFVKMKLLSVIDAGGDELVYFHTEKVIKENQLGFVDA